MKIYKMLSVASPNLNKVYFNNMKLKRVVFPCFENNESGISAEAEEQNVPRKSESKVLQIISTINVSLITFGTGATEYWVTPGLSYLKSSKSKWTLTMDQSSWIASAFDLGGIMGCLLYPFIIDRIGRKNSLIVFLLPQVLSWAMTYFANSFVLLCLARIISGIGYNAGIVVAFIYIGEIADKNIRGLLVSFAAIAFAIGALVIVIIGAFFSYDDMNLTFLTTSLLFIFLFSLMPESPYFYLKRNQEKDAMKSLSKLRGKSIDSKDLQMEMKNIQETIIKEKKHRNCLPSVFVKKGDRKALLISLLLRASTILSGGAVLTKYSQDIFKYSGIDLAPEYGTIILISLRVLAGIGMSPLFDYFGRRILILFSSAICSICLVIVGLFFLFKFEDVDLSSIAWLPLVALTLFKASSSGLYSGVGILGSETFSIEVKKSALAFSTIAEQSLSFLITLGFERTVSVFGIHYVFWLYAVMCFVPALVSFCIMPETKGKSLEEIQKILASNNSE